MKFFSAYNLIDPPVLTEMIAVYLSRHVTVFQKSFDKQIYEYSPVCHCLCYHANFSFVSPAGAAIMLFFRKHYLNRDFPLNRFQAADWPAWLASARWQPIDDIGHRGMSITIPQDNGEFAFDLPAAWVKNNTLPPLLLDILTQLNDIDNIMQQSCRRLAKRHKRHSREYELYLFDPPDALYVTQGGVPYLDYTATRVNKSFRAYLKQSGGKWLPYYDEACTKPLAAN